MMALLVRMVWSSNKVNDCFDERMIRRCGECRYRLGGLDSATGLVSVIQYQHLRLRHTWFEHCLLLFLHHISRMKAIQLCW